jgi:sialate O-acetylesterase
VSTLPPRVRRLAVGLGLAASLFAADVRSLRADVKLPAIFGNHMVLQRDQKDRLWGKADAGEEIAVSINDQTKTTKAGDDGRWSVTLDPLPAGGPHKLTVKGKNTVTFEDVLVGEVWICSGQSNMEWKVGGANDADLESLSANFPKIRFITVPKVGTQEPKDDFKGEWRACTPDSAKAFSAVGFFFGRQIHETIGVPIGLIDDSWGGSACEAWIRRDLLEKDPKYQPLMEAWAKRENSLPEARAKYAKDLAEYKEAEAKAKEEGRRPGRPPQDPDAQMTGNARPGNIYNGTLKPTLGYGMRGAIWYQGESNAARAYQYRELFPLMIQSWRDEWNIGDFSFYWVQLADFMAERQAPSDSSWAELREAQTLTMNRLPKTGQAVIIDLGEAQDIHPRNKLDVARRLARWALAKDYGVHVPYQSPTYKSMEKNDNKIILTFEQTGGGLKPFDVPELKGFTIANGDHKFVAAKAKLLGGNKVEVWSDEVSDPAAVRYAWADNPICNLYSKEGLPLTPFRTDDWPGVTANNKGN